MNRHVNLFKLYATQPQNMIQRSQLLSILNQCRCPITEEILSQCMEATALADKESLSFEQYICLVNYINKANLDKVDENMLRAAFKTFDCDSSGHIHSGFLRSILSENKAMDDSEIDELLGILNIDSNGNVNYEDFIKSISRTNTSIN
ncbi:hypothetical protein EDEG_00532 [Edhazardia aedis USNM 41457]|uniref:EF-hand domain-containing protein n=1 Tax=Edhazardia aedis (strain USNM 41457) TaxID=1003232 RepID=J9D107_EDHAE|nr:hypothetical protein EDEG_00532 [Edhazardia aedis USNM 41457]|eukprot:EJW01259.1 hypothetical protein EDEG_00532 [Edhazardia aedis USNM 41457]